jgi:hypothetical protein
MPVSNHTANENRALVEVQLAGENKRIRETTLIDCRFVHHKFKKDFTGIEAGPLQ